MKKEKREGIDPTTRWKCGVCNAILESYVQPLYCYDCAKMRHFNKAAPDSAEAWRDACGIVENHRQALEQIKLLTLTGMDRPTQLARILRICLDAGINEKLDELEARWGEKIKADQQNQP